MPSEPSIPPSTPASDVSDAGDDKSEITEVASQASEAGDLATTLAYVAEAKAAMEGTDAEGTPTYAGRDLLTKLSMAKNEENPSAPARSASWVPTFQDIPRWIAGNKDQAPASQDETRVEDMSEADETDGLLSRAKSSIAEAWNRLSAETSPSSKSTYNSISSGLAKSYYRLSRTCKDFGREYIKVWQKGTVHSKLGLALLTSATLWTGMSVVNKGIDAGRMTFGLGNYGPHVHYHHYAGSSPGISVARRSTF